MMDYTYGCDMRLFLLLTLLFLSVNTFASNSTNFYCLKKVWSATVNDFCSDNLSEVENYLKARHESFGQYLQRSSNTFEGVIRYHVPSKPADYAVTNYNYGIVPCNDRKVDCQDETWIIEQIENNIGTGTCSSLGNTTVTPIEDWVSRGYSRLDAPYGWYDEYGSGRIAERFDRTYEKKATYYTYIAGNCFGPNTRKTEITFTKNINYTCKEVAYSISMIDDYDEPQCEIPNAVYDVHVEQCHAPFTYDKSSNTCITYCPKGQAFDYGLGRCALEKDETPQCDALQHNPIDTSTGEKKQFFTDFIQNSSLPLSFIRSYGSLRSNEAKNTLYKNIDTGNKVRYVQPSWYVTPNIGLYEVAPVQKQGNVQWRHNYQISLAKYQDEDVIITLSDMTQRKFIFDEPSLTYSTPYPNGDNLKLTTDGWQYTDANQLFYFFDGAGTLTKISNELNEHLIFTYIDGKLAVVTNDKGETLSYSYNEHGLLTSVIQPSNKLILLNYDSRNNLTSVIYPDNSPEDLSDNPSEFYHYEHADYPYALTGITDGNGIRFASWDYNAIGHASNSIHAGNAEAGSIDYDLTNKKISSTNSAGNTTDITFDNIGRVTEVSGASCSTSGEKGSVSFVYNAQGQVELQTDESNAVTYTSYETSDIAHGKVNQSIKLYGTNDEQITNISYDNIDVSKPTQITHPNGLIENFTYGSNGRIETHSLTADGETRTTTYIYNTDGLLASIDGSRTDINDVTNFTYTNGRLASVTNALGHTTIFENYDGFGNATKITDANGVITQYTYDVRGWLRAIDIAGRVTQFDYDAIGQLVKSTQASGHFLSYTYDDARRLTDITNNSGENIHFTHDSEGNVTSQVIRSHDGNTQFSQQWVYDQINRLSQTVSATNQTWVNEYDVAGNLVKQITPANTELEGTFDKLKRAVQQADQADSLTNYEYDKLNQLTKVTDALGRETAYQYNGFGELITQISVDTGTTTFSYDLAGNLSAKTDERGITTTYIYDALNRLTSISYSDSSINNTTYNYDNADIGRYGIGQLTRVENNVSAIDYFYNEQGELTAEITSVNNQHTSQVYTVNYSYNADGQLKNITYPSGRIIEYTYNSIGLIEEVTSTYDGVTQTLASNIDYLPFGEMKSLTYGNGKTLTQTFNQNYQLTDKIIDSVLNKTFAYDPVNNIDFITDNLDANASEDFTYNLVDRLTEASGDYGDTSFDYDAIGNRLSKTKNNDTTNYVYQNNSQLTDVLGSSDITMTYDPSGNLLTKGNDSFTYNSEGRLNSATVNGITTNYHYNYLGQRIVKTFENGDNRYYVYDLQGLLIAELNSNAETQVEYVYVNGQRIAVIMNQPSTPNNQTDIILDNHDATLTGDWVSSTYVQGYIGSNYLYYNPLTASPSADRIVIDNQQASYIGTWNNSTYASGYHGSNYQYNDAGTGAAVATWSVGTITPAYYNVYAKWTIGSNRASNAKYTIEHSEGIETIEVNQKQNDNQWNLLGTYFIDNNSQITLNDDANGYVIADAISLVAEDDVAINNDNVSWEPLLTGEYEVYNQWSADNNRASNAQFIITHELGVDNVEVDQRINGGQWNLLGTYWFDNNSEIKLSGEADSYVIADALRIVPLNGVPTTTEQIYYVHTNHIDAPLALTDSNGDIVWQATYSPFGEITTSVDILPESFTARFPGQYSDTTTGFYYNYFRDYDPELGRYIQSDPIGLDGGINTYGYAYQNPINYYDPDGKLPVFAVLGLINGSISAAATYFSDDCASVGDLVKSFTFGFATGALGGVGSGFNAAKFSTSILGRQVPKGSSAFATIMAGMNGSMAGAADAAGSAMSGDCGCE